MPGDPFIGLFSESTARVLVTVADGDRDALADLAARHGVLLTDLGSTGGDVVEVVDAFTLGLDELRAAWTATIPAAMA